MGKTSFAAIPALAFAAGIMAIAAGPAEAGAVFGQASYNAVFTFTDALPSTTMTVAFDGTNYYSSSGGGSGSPYAEYDASGTLIGTNSPGIDFRSVFTDASGNLYARGYASNQIWKQTAFGSFSPYVTLTGGSLDDQSAVVLNTAGTGDISASGGPMSG